MRACVLVCVRACVVLYWCEFRCVAHKHKQPNFLSDTIGCGNMVQADLHKALQHKDDADGKKGKARERSEDEMEQEGTRNQNALVQLNQQTQDAMAIITPFLKLKTKLWKLKLECC